MWRVKRNCIMWRLGEPIIAAARALQPKGSELVVPVLSNEDLRHER